MSTRNLTDPFGRINGNPPPGYKWTLVEHVKIADWYGGYGVCSVASEPETREQKKARLLREAADLVRTEGKSEVVPPEDLRSSLIKLIEFLSEEK